MLAWAYPDRIAQRRPEGRGKYKLNSGRGAVLPPHDHLADQEYLVVADLDAGRQDGRIFLAAALEAKAIPQIFAQRLQRREEVFWDQTAATVRAQSRLLLDQLVLATTTLPDPDPEAVSRVLLETVKQQGLGMLPWTPATREFQARLESIRHWQPAADWPEVNDQALAADLEQWLLPWLSGIKSGDQLRRLDLQQILAARLDYRRQSYLEREVPTHLTVPSGSRRKLSYQPGQAPVLAVRLQEMFGLEETPKIVEGRIPVLLHLLSPASRPVQITSDLAGFWDHAYHQVRKELQGRYPKHHWPENPKVAQPTARTKKR